MEERRLSVCLKIMKYYSRGNEMSGIKSEKNSYHHGNLRAKLIELGLEVLEAEGAEALSLRELAKMAGVSKTAPYRHFKNKEIFLASLADEGFRLLYADLLQARGNGPGSVERMGRSYMAFAVKHPALYRLMNSSLLNRMPDPFKVWARKTLVLLSNTLAGVRDDENLPLNLHDATAIWAYIHGLVLIRIDGLYPQDLNQPDWEQLAGTIFVLPLKTS